MESVGQFDQLKITAETEMSLALSIFEDVEGEVMVASFGEQLFGDGRQEFQCTGVRYFSDAGSRINEGIVKCLSIELEESVLLFIDPTWSFGIKLGKSEDMKQWIVNHMVANSEIREHSLHISL
jgi:hypothetical protein